MQCPLCKSRRARRACPALNQDICPVCCGTKRLVEIRCPSDCGYLATAREHPPAATVRQQQSDMSRLLPAIRDLSDRQSRLFLLLATDIARYQPEALQPLFDADAEEAVASLASTYETAVRGVIYEHRPASLPAQRLAVALNTRLKEVGGSIAGFDRDAAVVLRRLEAAARAPSGTQDRRVFLELLGRVMAASSGQDAGPATGQDDRPDNAGPRLIVP